jgi:sugar phosphate isomerase/epimerase
MTRGRKAVGLLLGFAGLASMLLVGSRAAAVDFAKAIPKEYRVGGEWALGCQAYSFNRYSFFEAVDKAKETGCKLIEVFPGQKLSPENQTAFNHDAPPEVCEAAKKKCDEAGIKMVAYGVVGLGKDEAANRKVFEFCKKMGILVIQSEPPEEALPLVAKLAKEYDIPVALHNHPKPSRYWDPKHCLESVKDLAPWVGSGGDTGHWMRSEVNPLEAVKMLDGKIVACHIKDLNEFGGEGKSPHDVPFGTGQANMKAILDELRRQKFNGPMSIEYEYNWTTSVPEIKQCVDFVRAYSKNK